MKKIIGLALLSLVFLVLAACSGSEPPTVETEPEAEVLLKTAVKESFVAGELLVKFKEPSKVKSVLSASGIKLSLKEDVYEASGMWLFKFDARLVKNDLSAMQDLARLVSKLPELSYAQPNYIYYSQAAFNPNDPLFPEQWNMEAIEMPLAWGNYTRGSRVNVAVIDTGKTDHNDLIWSTGIDMIRDAGNANDFNGRDTDPTDTICPFTLSSNGHGTHVAGIIAAQTNNRQHIAGINESVRLIPVRVLGSCFGTGTTADVLAGMRWAAGDPIRGLPRNTNPAKILNLSLGLNLGRGNSCEADDPAMRDTINALADRDIITVVAAGNEGIDAATTTPASCTRAITVGSFNKNGDLSSFSNFGSVVDIYGPGGDNDAKIKSTFPGFFGPTTADLMGTSMAAPHVTGVISLMLSFDPTYNDPDAIAFLLRFHSAIHTPMPSGACPTSCGGGKLNAAALLHELSF
ncbi:MAG: S8 family serine peptidase [Trueperaceae bacterium]|nr:S8 family serine peptidase [Trueperaceae bacterium]